jgi:RimJ/RimL family protein N-acetyltransferase
LVAKIDPENVGSERVVQKAGFRRGEVVDGGYVKGGDGGVEKEQVWWSLERPVG